jgi:hypothetical protein
LLAVAEVGAAIRCKEAVDARMCPLSDDVD